MAINAILVVAEWSSKHDDWDLHILQNAV